MLPYLTDQYGNPHSRTHAYGWEAEQAVEDARKVRPCSFRVVFNLIKLYSTLRILLELTQKTSYSPLVLRKQTTWR